MPSVGRLIGQRLREAGVKYVMGHPGGEVADLIDGFRQEGLEFILTRHETSAVFMADAIGHYTGVPGVAVATLGPGATNLVTGIAHAYLDRSPVIAFSGQLPVDRYEITTHQKLDLHGVFAPITKWQARLTVSNADRVMQRALRVATRHRPGPVYIEAPSDVPRQEAKPDPYAPPVTVAAESFDPGAASAAAALLRSARRPVILAGLDGLQAAVVEPLRRLAEEWSIPVLVSPKAKGLFREDHPLFLGTIEMLGTGKLYDYIDGCDLVIMAGLEPVELDRDWTAAARIIHIGPLPNDDLYYHSNAEIVGPVAGGIVALLAAAGVPERKHDPADVRRARHDFWSFVNPVRVGMTSQQVLAALRQVLPEEALVTCDVGYNKAVTGQCWPAYQPRTFFMSNGLSSMGYGLSSALGLKLVNPERPVACIVGDGGFAMLLGEMETAVRRELPVTVVVLVDQALSMIKVGQERRGLEPTGTTFGAIDYLSLAKGFGALATEARTPAECVEAFRWAQTTGRPTVIAAYIDDSCYRL